MSFPNQQTLVSTNFNGSITTTDPTQNANPPITTVAGQNGSSLGTVVLCQSIFPTPQLNGTFTGVANIPVNSLITGIFINNFSSSAIPGGVNLTMGISITGTEILNVTGLTLGAKTQLNLASDFATGYLPYFLSSSDQTFYYATFNSALTADAARNIAMFVTYIQLPVQIG